MARCSPPTQAPNHNHRAPAPRRRRQESPGKARGSAAAGPFFFLSAGDGTARAGRSWRELGHVGARDGVGWRWKAGAAAPGRARGWRAPPSRRWSGGCLRGGGSGALAPESGEEAGRRQRRRGGVRSRQRWCWPASRVEARAGRGWARSAVGAPCWSPVQIWRAAAGGLRSAALRASLDATDPALAAQDG